MSTSVRAVGAIWATPRARSTALTRVVFIFQLPATSLRRDGLLVQRLAPRVRAEHFHADGSAGQLLESFLAGSFQVALKVDEEQVTGLGSAEAGKINPASLSLFFLNDCNESEREPGSWGYLQQHRRPVVARRPRLLVPNHCEASDVIGIVLDLLGYDLQIVFDGRLATGHGTNPRLVAGELCGGGKAPVTSIRRAGILATAIRDTAKVPGPRRKSQ